MSPDRGVTGVGVGSHDGIRYGVVLAYQFRGWSALSK